MQLSCVCVSVLRTSLLLLDMQISFLTFFCLSVCRAHSLSPSPHYCSLLTFAFPPMHSPFSPIFNASFSVSRTMVFPFLHAPYLLQLQLITVTCVCKTTMNDVATIKHWITKLKHSNKYVQSYSLLRLWGVFISSCITLSQSALASKCWQWSMCTCMHLFAQIYLIHWTL